MQVAKLPLDISEAGDKPSAKLPEVNYPVCQLLQVLIRGRRG